jgi:hypothetical protein
MHKILLIGPIGMFAALGAFAFGSPARATERYSMSGAYCAGGYHVDPQGNCQPDNGYVHSRCSPGFEPHAWPNGNNN